MRRTRVHTEYLIDARDPFVNALGLNGGETQSRPPFVDVAERFPRCEQHARFRDALEYFDAIALGVLAHIEDQVGRALRHGVRDAERTIGVVASVPSAKRIESQESFQPWFCKPWSVVRWYST